MTRQHFRFLMTLLVGIFLSFSSFAAAENDPTGFWNTFDHASGKVLSVVEITRNAQGVYTGKIVKIMPITVDGRLQRATDVCEACKDANKNKPILGLQIINNMVASAGTTNAGTPKEWAEGTVLDPKSGRIYSGYLQLLDNGQKLKLHGYVLGIRLLGRTEYWTRTTDPSQAATK